ncbi:TlpA disulfide reductase family protein [Hymenobacter properus]|uniref:AhpC/TSA family protein n=1 Tax=Hymenobacter properus TaxID=2791026 RepID=A0A931BJ81_9BACT|nr:TlpA disulfide reductase family protein [Hymenobacter properus]MBF9140470.1 AhpC/TSA family protein [Hymenobacter properus]MBR7719277.1 AhpC/TSA family protein [Microvirga sp. SRT04]
MHQGLLSLLLLLPGVSAAQGPVAFILQGQLGAGIQPPAKVYLYRNGEITDSASVVGGRFEIRGTSPGPGRASLALAQQGHRPQYSWSADEKSGFYLEAGTITFTSPDSLKNARLEAPPLTTEWQQLLTLKQPIVQRVKQLDAESEAATPAQRQSAAYREDRALRRAAIARDRNAVDSAFIMAHSASLVSLQQLDLISNAKENKRLSKQLFSVLSPALRTSAQGQKIAEKLSAPDALAVGMPAPDFTLYNPEGQAVALHSYRGKYVLVDFWASWCGPCRAENPNVARVYAEYKGRNFDVLGVSIDAPTARAKWLKAVQDDKMPWTQVLDSEAPAGKAAARYYVQAIPQNFLVDPNGKIVALNLRGEALKKTVAQLIK